MEFSVKSYMIAVFFGLASFNLSAAAPTDTEVGVIPNVKEERYVPMHEYENERPHPRMHSQEETENISDSEQEPPSFGSTHNPLPESFENQKQSHIKDAYGKILYGNCDSYEPNRQCCYARFPGSGYGSSYGSGYSGRLGGYGGFAGYKSGGSSGGGGGAAAGYSGRGGGYGEGGGVGGNMNGGYGEGYNGNMDGFSGNGAQIEGNVDVEDTNGGRVYRWTAVGKNGEVLNCCRKCYDNGNGVYGACEYCEGRGAHGML